MIANRPRRGGRPAMRQAPDYVAKPKMSLACAIYDDLRFPHIAETLCREYGMTYEQLGPIFGVEKRTIEAWAYKYPNFKKAVVAGRDAFDGVKVENALLKRALGYQFEEVSKKTVTVKAKHKYDDYEIRIPATETTVTIKELPADVKAIMFWLTNRQSERWKMVTTVNANIAAKTEHTQKSLKVTADLGNMGVEQLKALREMISAQPVDEMEHIAGGVDDDTMGQFMQIAHQMSNIEDAEEINP